MPTVYVSLTPPTATISAGASIRFADPWAVSTSATSQSMYLVNHHAVRWYHSIPTTTTSIDYRQWTTDFQTSSTGDLRTVRRPLARPYVQSVRERRASERRGRQVLRRSIDLFTQLRPAQEILTFLRGEPLEIKGHLYNYRIRRRDNLLAHSIDPTSAHIPYDFDALDRRTNRPLARGCVVLPGTPVIDQLLAVLMHLENPDDELELLRKTNWMPGLAVPRIQRQLAA